LADEIIACKLPVRLILKTIGQCRMNFKVRVVGMIENVRKEIREKEREKQQLANQVAQTISTTIPDIPTIDSTANPKEENF